MQSFPDMNELIKLASSPAGQQLLLLLKTSNLNLNQLAAEATSGNLENAKQQLAGILATEEAQNLLKQLEKNL